jgi:hypothetical protein
LWYSCFKKFENTKIAGFNDIQYQNERFKVQSSKFKIILVSLADFSKKLTYTGWKGGGWPSPITKYIKFYKENN